MDYRDDPNLVESPKIRELPEEEKILEFITTFFSILE